MNGTYDLWLVVCSYLVAVLAAYVALEARIRRAEQLTTEMRARRACVSWSKAFLPAQSMSTESRSI